MAITTLATPETQIPSQTPEATQTGRFFSPDSRSQTIDLHSLEVLRSDIIMLAGMIGAHATNPVVEHYELAFRENIDEYEGHVKDDEGLFRITFSDRIIEHSNAYNSLLEDYELPGSNSDRHTIEFSSDFLETARVLPFPQASTLDFSPVLDAKIRTSSDKPTQVFDIDAGGVVERPSGGRWYRFPLQDTEIHLLQVNQ